MKLKILLSTLIYSLIGVLMLFQTNIVLAIASDPNNPITAAITGAISDIVNPPSPSATPTPTPTPTPIATSSAAPSATPSAQPISSPIIDDSPICLDFWFFQICLPDFISPPISTPVVIPSPTPSPTPTPIATPAPTPTPVVTPVINTLFPNPANWGTVMTVSGSNLTNSAQVYINNSLLPFELYKPASEDQNSLSFALPSFIDLQAGQTYKLYVVQDGVKSNELDLSIAPSVRPDLATPNLNQVLINPQVSLDSDHPEVLVAYGNFNVNLSIPKSVKNPTLSFANILVTSALSKRATFNNILNINASTDLGTVKVEIPFSTTISGPLGWNGVINAPKILSASEANPVASSGKTAQTQAVLEVGAGDTLLTFDKAVRLLIPNQAGKLLGFQRGSTFTKITANCSADTQTKADALPADSECYISVGNDLVIWTKHFTKFVTYTETAVSNSSSSSNSSNSSAPSNSSVCADTKPQSAPKLISAKVSGRNEVTLTWSKAADPVTYYLVTYGTKSGSQEYGNPNIGGKDTTSYVVRNLQNNQTYYFKIRAGNNCMPGEFSNEIAVKASGNNTIGPAKGFKTASADADIKFKPITQAKPQRIVSEAGNVFTKLINFLTLLFNR